ncbi:MAG: ATP-binding protein [Gloeotrichia echinulata HAB0833]
MGDKDDLQAAKHSEIQSAISYIANELLENAIKFNDSSCSHPISIQLRMYADKLTFIVTNSIKLDAAEKYKAFIQQVLTRDPGEMLLRRLVKNAEEDHLESPGIGILCMMNDYLVTIGCKFTKIHENSEIVTVTTMVQLII